jgi:DNA-binding LytR/AlgR family response regulator
MIDCIIVDDEPLARQLIASYIDQIPDMQCSGSYQTVSEAFTAMHERYIDVLFLDIEMPGITGLNFIKSLRISPKVIFVTAYTEYAVDAFELEAIDYLVKPVTFERFLKAIQKVGLNPIGSVANRKHIEDISFIFLKVDKRLVKINISDIMYIESFGDYLKVNTISQTYVTYMTLGKLESLLPPSKFVRIHRATIVNTTFIKFIEGNLIKINNTDLIIGQTYRESLLKVLCMSRVSK